MTQKLIVQIGKGKSLSEKLSRNIYLRVICGGFISAMLVILFSSIFLLITYVLNVFGSKWDKGMEAILMKPYNCTVGPVAFLVVGTTTKSLADSFNRKLESTNQINFIFTMLAAMCGLLFLTSDPVKNGGFLGAFMGARGLLTAFLSAFVTAIVYNFCMRRNTTIRTPKEVPPSISRVFKDLTPSSTVVTILYALDLVVRNSFKSNAAGGILKLFEPLSTATDGWIGVTIIFGAFALLWFVGIRGPSIAELAVAAIAYANIEANFRLLQAGEHTDKIITSGTQMFIAIFGSTGATLVAPFMFIWMTKPKRNKAIGRTSVIPTFFGVNEPILFGTPLVLNPVFFIPFVLAPIVNVWIFKLFVEVLGMNSFSMNLPWTTPGLLGVIMSAGFDLWSLVLTITLIVADIIIYYPFLKVCDGEIFDEEEECKESNSDSEEKVAANFDMRKADSILAISGVSDDAAKALDITEQANVLVLCVGDGTDGLLANVLNKAIEEYHVLVKAVAGGYGAYMDIMKEYQLIISAPQVASNYEDTKQNTDGLSIRLTKTQGAEYIELTRDGQAALDFVQQQLEN